MMKLRSRDCGTQERKSWSQLIQIQKEFRKVCSHRLKNERFAYALLIVYFMLSIDIYLATFTTGSFRLSFWIFGPTELRVLICIGNIVVTFHPISQLFGMQFRLLDAGGMIAIPVLSIILIS